MRIGQYMDGMWDNGGIASYIRRIGAAQTAAGHTVYYLDRRSNVQEHAPSRERAVVVRDDGDLFLQARALGLDILHLHCPVEVLPPDHVPTIRSIHWHSPYCPSGSRYLERWGRLCDRSYSFGTCLWGHIVDHCGSVRPQNLRIDFKTTWDERRILPQILSITDSGFLKEQMVRAGYAESMIYVLRLPPPNIEDAVPPPREGVPRFVYLGRIERLKGVDWLLRAFHELEAEAHLDIAGDGPLAPEMRRLAERLALNRNVTFHGWVSEAEVIRLLQSARALILPSVWHEPGATVAVEAMASARALIISCVGGMPEVTRDEVNGLTVAPNNVRELARAVERLAGDWSLAWRMGLEGRKMVEAHYTQQKHLEALMDLYRIAIERQSDPKRSSCSGAVGLEGAPR